MRQSRAGDVDTGTRAWTVLVGRSAAGLARALEQAASVSPPEQTCVVVTARRPHVLAALPPGRAHVLVEPLDRGSAAAILFPVHWIHARDPEATVVVFGDDPPRGAPGVGQQIVGAARLAAQYAESIVLLGLPPGLAEPERGSIVPDARIDSTVGGRLLRVRELVDAASEGDAPLCAGTLGDGAVFAGRVKAFIGAASEHVAALNDRLARAATFAGQEHERWALRQAYALAPCVDFFRAVLRPIAHALAVLEIHDVGRLGDGADSIGLATGSTVTAPL